MGYLRDGKWITTHSYTTAIEKEIGNMIEEIYQRRYGRQFSEFRFNGLSSQEQNDIIHDASVEAQRRRRRR